MKLTKEDALKRMKLEKPKIDVYKKLCERVLLGRKQRIYNQKYYDLVTDLLEWNQELYTVWNYRKELITNFVFKSITKDNVKARHDILVKELEFVLKKLKQSPKSYWIWNHRVWCLKLDKLSNWLMELQLIETFLKVDSRNYHAWSYRRLIAGFMKNDPEFTKSDELIDFDEFKFTTKMINKDISNYSAWHNRSQLIVKLFLKSPKVETQDGDKYASEYVEVFAEKDKIGFLKKELSLVKTAIYTDPEDSSVWFYLKWLISDYFIDELTSTEEVLKLLEKLSGDVEELNEVEFDDNGVENKWCLITEVYLMKRLFKLRKSPQDSERFHEILNKLKLLDIMRTERYKEIKLT